MRIGRLVLPLLSSEGHPLAQQHKDAVESLLGRFGQVITSRVMCITRTPAGDNISEHGATYEPIAVTTDEDWAFLNATSESFKVAVAKVNEAEAAELVQELARAAAEGETVPVYRGAELARAEAETASPEPAELAQGETAPEVVEPTHEELSNLNA